MKLLSNKHVIVAMVVTPLLAIAAWVIVGTFIGEQPHKAVAGKSYPLVEQSNCRYESSYCDLRNEDVQLRLSLAVGPEPTLLLTASHPLNGVLVSIGASETDSPEHMQPADQIGTLWQLPLTVNPVAEDTIRLVASAGKSTYFAETSPSFVLTSD